MKKIVCISAYILFGLSLYAQDYKQLIAEGESTVEEIIEVAERHFDTVGRERGRGYKPFRRWQYFAERAMDESGKVKSPEFYYKELQDYNARINNESLAARTIVGTWQEMGPTYWNATSGYNPGVGRITSIATEKGNQNHIIVGSDTGGVWKSLNGGTTWTVLTDNLANMDVYALAIDPLNSSTYFWGSYGGSIFKSVDGGATWSLLGNLPGGGRVNKILVHPTDTSKMYCSSEGGGLFKSVDGGFNWSIIHHTATNGYDFEFKSGDPDVIYASGNNVYKSVNGGLSFEIFEEASIWDQEFISGSISWTTSGSNINNSVVPRTGESMGLFYVENYSNPMTQLISPALDLSETVSPELKFSFTQVGWDGDIDALKVLYKTSATANWIELANYTAEVTNWSDITLSLPNPSANYYVAFEGTANYGRGITLDDVSIESSNLGVVFSDGFESTSNAFGFGPKLIGVSPDNPSVVYVLEAKDNVFGGIYKSTDNGSTFSKLNHTNKNYFGYDSFASDDKGQAPRDMAIAVNPNNINDVHIAGINTWRSTNGGTDFTISSQWTPYDAYIGNVGYCHADVDILEFVGNGANTKLLVGTDGGIYSAENPTVVNNQYYTDLTAGLGIRQFYKIGVSQTNPVIVTGGSQDNGSSILGSDGNWTDWFGADGMEGFIDKNNSQVIYGTAQYGNLIKSFDSGANVSYLTQPEDKGGDYSWNWVVPFEQDPVLQNVVYCAFDVVYKSVDGGFNWIAISPEFSGNIDHFKVASTNSNIMYVAINGIFVYSTDGGMNWVQSSLNLGGGRINEIAVHPTDPSKIAIATTNNQKVYISTDNGASFTSVRWDLPGFSSQALTWQDNGKDGLYVGMNYGIYYTDNELGNTWTAFNNGLPNVRINELEINAVEGKIYAATYGRGLWSSNLYDETLGVNNFELDDLVLYPNPATSEVKLKWNVSEDVSIRIYNTLGKLMFYTKSENLTNDYKINLSTFKTGVYFVKLNTSKGEITKKLILN
ncbi:T9SS type A sorting domain-containing protein [Winogradskyella bathintestinalis]|uniref:T9SS type A sorting domain-containing protein n=1 Tax=Winogradskyella bathintestinalis TaxID=3035208 RepID=A0ABT7ZU24_9FLAO|nr:T9SS type A sorting domain-containing protein [Winogradskyella bathintestinalis]MDN3492510.1 T9SS type A sorting domain-containing protein [Winogradskyella bathintestinalis]